MRLASVRGLAFLIGIFLVSTAGARAADTRTHALGAADKATSLTELESRRGELLDTVNHLSDQVAEIREHLNRSRFHCELVVRDAIKSGVKLRLAEVPRLIEEDLPACRFYLETGDAGLQVRMGAI